MRARREQENTEKVRLGLKVTSYVEGPKPTTVPCTKVVGAPAAASESTPPVKLYVAFTVEAVPVMRAGR